MTDQPNDPLDQLLQDGLVKTPPDFADNVLKKIAHEAPFDYSNRTAASTKPKSLWTSAALIASTALGGFQIISFILGIWIPATAG